MRLYGTLITLLLFSCNSGSSNTSDNKNSSVSGIKTISKAKMVLLTEIKPHFFSDSLTKDTFKLVLRGDSLTTSSAIFSIITHNGKEIYADTFDANWLEYVPQDTGTPTIAQYEKSIGYKASQFFNDSNFVNALKVPAIATCGDNGIPDSVNWFDIHSYKKVIGFHYWFDGSVDDNYLAWSKKKQQVVIYWYNND